MVTSQIAKWATVFIGVIVLFSAIATLYPTASDAGNQLNASNMCSDASCFYNGSRTTTCTANNATAQDTTACATAVEGGLPLGSLFAGGGVIFVILAAGLLYFVIKKKGM